MSGSGKAEEQLRLVADEVSSCKRCVLHHSRKLAVPGEGPANAEIMFIGEGPGFHENEQGRPFVGAAGKFLDELLESIKMKRSQVFIGNVVKCRPPGNRDPQPEELAGCSEYLERQIQAINPKVIVTLGRFSMAHFLPNAKISEVHGQAVKVRGRLIVAMYHPAAALHQRALKSTIEADFARLPELIAAAEQRQETPASAAPSWAAPAGASGSTSPNPGEESDQPEAQVKKEPKQLSLF
jgi:DNA polymerase